LPSDRKRCILGWGAPPSTSKNTKGKFSPLISPEKKDGKKELPVKFFLHNYAKYSKLVPISDKEEKG